MTCAISCETGYPSAIILLTSLFATSNSPDLQAASSDLTTSSGMTWHREANMMNGRVQFPKKAKAVSNCSLSPSITCTTEVVMTWHKFPSKAKIPLYPKNSLLKTIPRSTLPSSVERNHRKYELFKPMRQGKIMLLTYYPKQKTIRSSII